MKLCDDNMEEANRCTGKGRRREKQKQLKMKELRRIEKRKEKRKEEKRTDDVRITQCAVLHCTSAEDQAGFWVFLALGSIISW